jgi:pimeloyl-ACP methyl ester carboxylesterase
LFLIAISLSGCATQTIAPQRPNTVIVVPGIGGDGGVYAGIIRSLEDHGSNDCLCVSDWGSSFPICPISISSSGWHRSAERNLATQIVQWRQAHPDSRIAIIAHSAGAGVVAGAVAQLPPGETVGPILLLAPALSPGFDLRPMLRHATVVHVFFSHEDFFWQGIGPTILGNYDRVHSSGAGRLGFTLASLDPLERQMVVQHAWQPQWKSLDNNGGHYDWLAEPFVAAVLKPIIDAQPAIALITSDIPRSSSANRN